MNTFYFILICAKAYLTGSPTNVQRKQEALYSHFGEIFDGLFVFGWLTTFVGYHAFRRWSPCGQPGAASRFFCCAKLRFTLLAGHLNLATRGHSERSGPKLSFPEIVHLRFPFGTRSRSAHFAADVLRRIPLRSGQTIISTHRAEFQFNLRRCGSLSPRSRLGLGISHSAIFDSRKRRQAMNVAPATAENMLHRNPAYDERVRQERAMTPPGHRLRAHRCAAFTFA
jgi:hypothetical protein